MITNNNSLALRVWGDYACFTRPEMKVELVGRAQLARSPATVSPVSAV